MNRLSFSRMLCSALPVLLLATACLKGGTTGTPGTDDTGTVADEGGTSGSSPTQNGKGGAGGTDDTAGAPTGATKGSGTDDNSGQSAVEGKPGDPCTLGSDCLNGICPKTTKTCDGCLNAGGACKSTPDCCGSASTNRDGFPYCGSGGICRIPKVRKKGDFCELYDTCAGPGGKCDQTLIPKQGAMVCVNFCNSDADCTDTNFGPICDVSKGAGKSYCTYFYCSTSSQCKDAAYGRACTKLSNGLTRCGCTTSDDCPTSRPKCTNQQCGG